MFASALQKVQLPRIISLLLLGGIAQLVERLHGMQEVSGSIPLTSTKLIFCRNDEVYLP